jgi:uncharacterized protein YjbI with pentapeptide repeats
MMRMNFKRLWARSPRCNRSAAVHVAAGVMRPRYAEISAAISTSRRLRVRHPRSVKFSVRIHHKFISLWLLFASSFAGFVIDANAQRSFSLTVVPTNQNAVAIKWKTQSATPVGDLVVLPQFQVERSSDLRTWLPVSGMISSALGQTNTFTDNTTELGFYRVNSIIQKEYAQMSNAKLNSGQLQFADFFGATLFGAHLVSATLSNAILSAADLRSADLSQADLSGADLFGVNAFLAKFDSGTMTGADASFGNFESASLFNVDLTGADFSFATLTGADLDFATFNQTQMDANTLIDAKPKLIWQIVNTGATNAVLTNKDLSFARFDSANFNGARLNNSDFSASFLDNADIRGANFTNANMRFVSFQGTLMDATTIIDSKSRLVWQIINQNFGVGRDLHGTNLASVDLEGANFSSANLSNTVCTLTIFEQANFGGANLLKANCTQADFFQASLTNANLSQVNFNSADLIDASLRNSTTNGATFIGTIFSNTIMPDGSIRNF